MYPITTIGRYPSLSRKTIPWSRDGIDCRTGRRCHRLHEIYEGRQWRVHLHVIGCLKNLSRREGHACTRQPTRNIIESVWYPTCARVYAQLSIFHRIRTEMQLKGSRCIAAFSLEDVDRQITTSVGLFQAVLLAF
jgi:hypothetical protein